MKSRSLLLTEPGCLEWTEENLPPLQANEMLVQTIAGAISIGSELPQYCGMAPGSEVRRYPRMTGYESVGRVIACGSEVRQPGVGDRVVAFYGHSTHGIVAEDRAIVVPDSVSDMVALLSILSCDVSKGIRKVMPEVADTVLVTGAGTMGLLTVYMLKAFGIESVDVLEPLAERRELALLLGARTALSPQEIGSKSEKYAVGIECSSRNAAFELLQESVQHGGYICVLADGNVESLVLMPTFHEKELRVVGSSDGEDYQGHAKWFFRMAQKHADKLERLFDYQILADELIDTFENMAKGEITPIKVLVKYY
ncbi:MAG: alcohol dehydrogenase catalytic domain-containing protein [Ktedonobacteraceae bacterium]